MMVYPKWWSLNPHFITLHFLWLSGKVDKITTRVLLLLLVSRVGSVISCLHKTAAPYSAQGLLISSPSSYFLFPTCWGFFYDFRHVFTSFVFWSDIFHVHVDRYIQRIAVRGLAAAVVCNEEANISVLVVYVIDVACAVWSDVTAMRTGDMWHIQWLRSVNITVVFR